jgi:ubiquitin fusion degradation protein 1
MLTSGELAASERRLKEHTKAQVEKARLKAEKERILAERQKQRQDAREEDIRLKRLEQLRIEEEQRESREREIEANNGVIWRGKLQAVPAPEDIAASKGIKRAADKVLLPPSAGSSLLNQDAFKNGAYFFELKHASGRRTHAGLLDFTAAEGFIALPRKVGRCLFGVDAAVSDADICEGTLEVAYRRLPKATKAIFQPRSALFQQAIGEDLREALEAALLQHSALTVGDWIEVRNSNGDVFDLRVRELEPAEAVSIIDTEVEAEIHPSVETEERILAEEMEAQRRMTEAAAAVKKLAQEEAEKEAEKEAEFARRRSIMAEKAVFLEQHYPEPTVESGVPAITCLFRLPDGGRHTRRFSLLDTPLNCLFDYVDSIGASGKLPGEYRLVTQYPRHVFEYPLAQKGGDKGDEKLVAGEAGLPSVLLKDTPLAESSRQVLFLEPILET